MKRKQTLFSSAVIGKTFLTQYYLNLIDPLSAKR